jgi:hypothetical protein
MKVYPKEVSRCWECPALLLLGRVKCSKLNRTVSNLDEIPEWCPLPDAPEKETGSGLFGIAD